MEKPSRWEGFFDGNFGQRWVNKKSFILKYNTIKYIKCGKMEIWLAKSPFFKRKEREDRNFLDRRSLFVYYIYNMCYSVPKQGTHLISRILMIN